MKSPEPYDARRAALDSTTATTQPRPSAEDAARLRMARPAPVGGRRFKTLERFGYWQLAGINRWRVKRLDDAEIAHAAHAELIRQYGDLHRDGDPCAIFDYARADAWCFRSAWFVEQLEQWRDAGEDAKLRKVMASFAGNESKLSNDRLRETVARDQRVFSAIVNRPESVSLNRCYADLANEFEISEDTARDIYEAYRDYFQAEADGGVTTDVFFARLADMLTRFP